MGKPVCLRHNVSGVPSLRVSFSYSANLLQYFYGDPNFRAQNHLGAPIPAAKNATFVVRKVVEEIMRETAVVPQRLVSVYFVRKNETTFSEKLYADAVMVESNSHLENTLASLLFEFVSTEHCIV